MTPAAESRSPAVVVMPAFDDEMSKDEYVYGINTVLELVSHYPGEVRELLLARDKRDPRLAGLLEQAEAAGIVIHSRPSTVLSKLAGNDHHQGLVAVVEGFRYTELETLQEQLKSTAQPLVVVLDGIQDPGNLGALLRSAHLMGASGVVVPKDRACGVTPAARKASAGAAMHLPVVQATNIVRAMELLFEGQGLWMLGLDQGAPQTLDQLDLTVPVGLVVGGEEKGIRPIVRKACQLKGRIPQLAQSTGVDSLNASVAGAIALYEIQRQRLAKK